MPISIETRLAAGSPKITTELTLDWSGVTKEQERELAERSLVISLQRVYRDAGKIPAKDSVKVVDFLAGKGRPEKVVTPEKVLAQIPTMKPEDRQRLLAALQAASAKK